MRVSVEFFLNDLPYSLIPTKLLPNLEGIALLRESVYNTYVVALV
jgi:hypothetical protein